MWEPGPSGPGSGALRNIGGDPRVIDRMRWWALLILAAMLGCSVAPSPSLTDRPTPVGPGGPAVDPWASLAWLAGRDIEVDDIAAAVELTLVRGDGTASWQAEIPIDPAGGGGLVVAGPRNGVLVYGTTAGDETQLHRVDAQSGSDEIFATISGSVVGTALDATGTQLFAATVGSDDLAIASIALDGSGEIELHREPSVGKHAGGWDRLHATPDGRRLVLDRCDGRGCSWLVLGVADGTRTELSPSRAGDRLDLSNDTLLGTMSGCSTGPCPFMLVNLATGAAEVWDPAAHVARLGVATDGATILLHDQQVSANSMQSPWWTRSPAANVRPPPRMTWGWGSRSHGMARTPGCLRDGNCSCRRG